MLSELMMQLNAVDSLCKAGFFEMSVWIKFQTITLYQTYKSVGLLSGYLRRCAGRSKTPEFLRNLDGMLSRENKKTMKRIRPLRNALIHYDFSEANYPKLNEPEEPWALLEAAVFQSTGYSLPEYVEFLVGVGLNYRQGLDRLLSFPRFNPVLAV